MNMINLLSDVKPSLLTSGFVDDFEYLSLDETGSEGRWNTTDGDTGASVAHDADGINGVVTLTTGATDNNEAYLASKEIFEYRVGKPALLVCRLQFTESATNLAKVGFGLGESIGGNQILDNTNGFSGALDNVGFLKNELTNNWALQINDTTLGKTTVDLEGTAGGASYQTLALHIDPISATECIYTPLMDLSGGNNLSQAYELNANARCPKVQVRQAFTASLQMSVFVGVKAASASSEVVNVDLISFNQVR